MRCGSTYSVKGENPGQVSASARLESAVEVTADAATNSIAGAGAPTIASRCWHHALGPFQVVDPRHANLNALVHVSALLSRVVRGTQNGHLDRDKLVAPQRLQFSMASSTRGAHNVTTWKKRSVMRATAGAFTTVQHYKNGQTYPSKNLFLIQNGYRWTAFSLYLLAFQLCLPHHP